MARCKAKTQKGDRCKNDAAEKSDLCYVHKKGGSKKTAKSTPKRKPASKKKPVKKKTTPKRKVTPKRKTAKKSTKKRK